MNHTYLNQHRKGFEPNWKPVVWIDWRKTICTNMRTSRSIKCSQWRSGLRTFPLQLSVTWLDVVRRGLVLLFISWQMSQTINCHDVHNSDTSVFQKICTWKNKCVYSRVQKSKITLRYGILLAVRSLARGYQSDWPLGFDWTILVLIHSREPSNMPLGLWQIGFPSELWISSAASELPLASSVLLSLNPSSLHFTVFWWMTSSWSYHIICLLGMFSNKLEGLRVTDVFKIMWHYGWIQ